jgi:hypothetical protein
LTGWQKKAHGLNNLKINNMPYIIIDLSRSTKTAPMFWRANNHGYTTDPFEAGVYSDATVLQDWRYYNDGVETVAIPLKASGLELIDLEVSIKWNSDKALKMMEQNALNGKPQPNG